jgi:hypothetical protein
MSINQYAKNFRYTDEKNKKYLSQLTSTLKENQWLKVSKDKFSGESINNIYKDTERGSYYDLKPAGSWFSKGSWLFHEDMCCKMNDEVIMVEVDYSRILRIHGKGTDFKRSFDDFTTKYGRTYYPDDSSCDYTGFITDSKVALCRKKTKAQCKETEYCRWYETPPHNIYDWKKVSKKYDGFAIYPIPNKKFLDNAGLNRIAFLGWDVESLILWDAKPVIRYANLGKIKDIIGATAGTKSYQDSLPALTKNLVKTINGLNRGC